MKRWYHRANDPTRTRVLEESARPETYGWVDAGLPPVKHGDENKPFPGFAPQENFLQPEQEPVPEVNQEIDEVPKAPKPTRKRKPRTPKKSN